MKLTDKSLLRSVLRYLAKHPRECEFLLGGQTAGDIPVLKKLLARGAVDCLAGLSPAEVRRLWMHLVTDAINVLKWCDIRERPPGGNLRFRAWLRQTFGHLAFGIEELDEYFREFVEFEDILYGAERYYRDHFLHVLRVWLIGMVVLTQRGFLPAHRFRLDFPEDRKFEFPFSIPERLAIWTMIALCHDLGYPLEKISGINTPLRKMLNAVGRPQVRDFAFDFPSQQQFIDNFIMQYISSKLVPAPERSGQGLAPGTGGAHFKTAIQPKYYLKLSKSYEELRHGILGCTLLMKRLVFFLEADFDISPDKLLDREDARQFLIRREILRAIATHTCRDIYHLQSETFAFLLIVCDELQEWDRPTLREMRGAARERCEAHLERYNTRRVAARFILTPPAGEDFSEEMVPNLKKVFRRLHKILRSAVYVEERRFGCKWEFHLQGGRAGSARYIFEHTPDNVASVLIDGRPDPGWLYG